MTHFTVSIFKSLLRIGGFVMLTKDVGIAVTILVTAEIFGIFEELV